MIYIIIFLVMAIAAFVGYEMYSEPFEDNDKKTPK
jgi:hypothetical protein